jgi:hypothetical protein
VLHLRNGQFADSVLVPLAKMKWLKTLDLTGTQPRKRESGQPIDRRFLLTDNAIAELRRALPHTNVIR